MALAVVRRIGDLNGVATISFTMALLYTQQEEVTRALPLAQEAARIWAQIGSPNAQQAQQLVAQLQGGGPVGGGPSPAEILQQFAPVIEAVVAAAGGHAQARAAVEQLLPQLKQNGWHIAAPIHRIWAGERDEAALTTGLDDADTLIIREILKRLASGSPNC